jgi:hypothetical protein
VDRINCRFGQVFAFAKTVLFSASDRGVLAWDVDRLVELSRSSSRKHVPLSKILELDQAWSSEDGHQTWRAMLEHLKLMDEADLAFPVILSSDGRVMDGMHRIAKAVHQGRDEIEAVQFDVDPEPDFVGLGPNDLPY